MPKEDSGSGKTGSVHIPVLLHEVVKILVKPISESDPGTSGPSIGQPMWYLDGTLGGAGHAIAVAAAFRKSRHMPLNIFGLDVDPQAVEAANRTFGMTAGGGSGGYGKVVLECQSFRNLDKALDKHGIAGVDMILFDLGYSSDQLDDAGRGFSFQRDEPLIMTLGDPGTYPFTAGDIVNSWEEDVIADIIFGYGEDRFARRIAGAIAAYRTKKKIETSGELAEIIKSAVPSFSKPSRIHPATKTFQALRIAVNDELNALKEGISKGYERLNKGGRMAVIAFHSLEDRIIKNFYKEQSKHGASILTKKPISPTYEEMSENPRSRSAKLRAIEK